MRRHVAEWKLWIEIINPKAKRMHMKNKTSGTHCFESYILSFVVNHTNFQNITINGANREREKRESDWWFCCFFSSSLSFKSENFGSLKIKYTQTHTQREREKETRMNESTYFTYFKSFPYQLKANETESEHFDFQVLLSCGIYQIKGNLKCSLRAKYSVLLLKSQWKTYRLLLLFGICERLYADWKRRTICLMRVCVCFCLWIAKFLLIIYSEILMLIRKTKLYTLLQSISWQLACESMVLASYIKH